MDWFIDMFKVGDRVRVKEVEALGAYRGLCGVITKLANGGMCHYYLMIDGHEYTTAAWFEGDWLEQLIRPKVVPLPLPG